MQSCGNVFGDIADQHAVAAATAVNVTHERLVNRQERIPAATTNVACALRLLMGRLRATTLGVGNRISARTQCTWANNQDLTHGQIGLQNL